MANDLSQLAARLADLERRYTQLARTSRLAYSSIENGAIDVYDESGSLRAVIGQQPDGTTGINPVNAPPPPSPAQPAVTSVYGGIAVTWDGTFIDAIAAPLDFARTEIHASTADGFTPSEATLRGTLESPRGGTLTTPAEQPLYVRLLARNTSGTPSTPSAQAGPAGPARVVAQELLDGIVTEAALAAEAVSRAKLQSGAVGPTELAADAVAAGRVAADTITGREVRALSLTGDELSANSVTAGKIAAGAVQTPHLAVGAVTPDQIAVGQGTNLVPDPGFEGAATANTIAAGGAPWSLAPGNRTGVGIRVDCAADTTTYFTLPLATVPVLAASQLFLGVDVLVSDDLAAQGVKILARWEESTGAVLGYGVAESTAPIPGQWQRISGQVAAPQGCTRAVLCLEVSAATLGWAVFDNAEAIPVFGRVTGGARAELGPQGLLLYDENGDETVSLVTGQANYLTLRDGDTRVAAIGSTGDASFQSLNVAGTLTLGGDDITTLNDGPRGIIAVDWVAAEVSTSTGTEMGYVELAFDAVEGRMYRIAYDGSAQSSAVGGVLVLKLRSGFAAAPLVTSTQIQESRHPLTTTGRQRVRLEVVADCTATGRIRPGRNRLLLTFNSTGGPTDQSISLYGASGQLGHMTVEDLGETVPETGVYNTGGAEAPDPPVKSTRTYKATWSGSYANRSGYNAYYASQLVGGYYSANNGTQAALVGFGGTLAADLSGATLLKVEIYLYANHWYYASGGTAVLKAHGHTARPAKFSSDQAESKTVTGWARSSGKWTDITAIFDSITFRGIAIDPNTTNRTCYGKFDGVGQPHPPQLRVTYVK
ncbi:hypothetical protein [Streptomyces sp. NPDC058614]|uniref:hypothetical protein n=1 Tax=Streptomyces sp. NPDC058614 TaxID=3346557 RepID=UPI0036576594